jgi:hypothetical protein
LAAVANVLAALNNLPAEVFTKPDRTPLLAASVRGAIGFELGFKSNKRRPCSWPDVP